jgi:phage gp29-like protein
MPGNLPRLQEVAAGLLALYPQLGTEALAESLRQALVLAELAGRADMAQGEG